MSAKFYVKDKALPVSQVFTVYYHKGTQKKIAIGVEINPQHWNPAKQRVKELKIYPQYVAINRTLDDVDARMMFIKNNPDKFKDFDEIKTYIKGIENETPSGYSVLNFFEKIVLPRHPHDHSVFINLKNFFRINGEYSWLDIQKKHFALKFQSFMETQDYSQNYIGRHFKVIKSLLNSAHSDYELIAPPVTKHMVTLREDVDNIYLTIDELSRLFDLELIPFSKLDNVRDRFLIGCFTGLRFNDYNRFDPAKNLINEGSMIKITTGNQTGNKSTTVVIPIHPIVRAILVKRNYILPRNITNQKMNDYLKELGELAGINTPVNFYKTIGGKRVEISDLKYNLITTHTARRSFATNAFLSGMSSSLIMRITGHKTESSFLKYVKATPEQTALLLAHSPFFQAPVERR